MFFTSIPKKRNWFFLQQLAVCCILTATSCKKDSFITSTAAKLEISADSLKYDTVFTSTGSVTQSFKINNTNSQRLLISTIRLQGGTGSAYRINVNGIAAQEVNDIEVAANDSIYVFVTVNINPTSANLPFIVRDSIAVNYNGNIRFVQLQAYGQNAHFLRNTVIAADETWVNDLPYVILGGIQVDTNVTLRINAGCKIYSNAYAPFLIDGSLVTNGTKDEPVVFTGDRLDEDYRDLPASWPGIYFRGTSKNNMLNFTSIKNAYQALAVQGISDNSNPKLIIDHCIIDNAYDAGLFCVNSTVDAGNSLISNCGSNINIILGGQYNFTHCTVAAYSVYLNHTKPVLSASNAALVAGTLYKSPLYATFTNCIFWGEDGTVKNEVQVNKEGADPVEILMDHCLYKAETDPANVTFNECIKNQQPLFDSTDRENNYFDFNISSPDAPGVDKGTNTPPQYVMDLNGKLRSDGKPDTGCYEKK